jgi:hypothetical protein
MGDKNDRSLDDVSAYQTQNAYIPYLTPPQMPSMYGGYAHPLAPLVTPPMPVMFSNPGLAASYQMSYPAASAMAGWQNSSQMNLPASQFMTPSNLGGFRNLPPSSLGAAGFRQRPQAPYMPFAPLPESSMFTRPETMAYQYAQQASRYGSAQEIAAMNAGATALTGIAGAGIGAGVGGYFGGVNGARIGAAAGGIFANAIPGLHGLVSDMFQPALRDYGYGARLSQASSRYMVGGQGLDISGQGMALPGAMRVGRAAGDIAEQSRGTFNRRDIVNITQYSGDIGLLDQAHNADQVIESVRNISKVVATFARIVGDPDIKRSIALMGEMRRMGGSTSDMLSAMRGFDSAARAAGTDITGLMERGGRPGALAFQNMGLSGFEGMRVGAQSLASAQQAVNTGSVSTLQLGLMGGVSGMAQSRTNAVAGFLGGQGLAQIMPFLVKHTANGLELDQSRIKELMSGGGTFADMVSKGSGNIGGPLGIQQLQTQMPELRSQLAHAVGPAGMELMMMSMAKKLQRDMGGNITLETAMQSQFGMTGPESSSFVKQYTNQETYNRLIKQQQDEDNRMRVENADQLRRAPGALSRLGRRFSRATGIHAMGEMWDNAYAGVGDYLAEREQRGKDAAFGVHVERFGDIGGDITTPGGFGRARDIDLAAPGRLGSFQGISDRFQGLLTRHGMNDEQRAVVSHTGGLAGLIGGLGLSMLAVPVSRTGLRGEAFSKALVADRARLRTQEQQNASVLKQLNDVTAPQAEKSRSIAIDALKKKGVSESATQAFIDAVGNSLATTGQRQGNLFGGGATEGQSMGVAIQEGLASMNPKDQEVLRAALADPKIRDHLVGAASQVAKDVGGDENWNRLVNKAQGAAGETAAISGADSIERIHAHAVTRQKDIMDEILSGGKGGFGTSIRNFFMGNRRLQTGNQLQGLSAAAGKGHENWVAAALLGGKALSTFRNNLSPADQKAFADFEKKTGIHSDKFRDIRADLQGQSIEGLTTGINKLENDKMDVLRAGLEHEMGVSNTDELRAKYGKKGETDEALYTRLAKGKDLSQYTSVSADVAKTGAQGSSETASRLADIVAASKDNVTGDTSGAGDMAVVASSFAESTQSFSKAVEQFTGGVGGKSLGDALTSAKNSVSSAFSDNPYNGLAFNLGR